MSGGWCEIRWIIVFFAALFFIFTVIFYQITTVVSIGQKLALKPYANRRIFLKNFRALFLSVRDSCSSYTCISDFLPFRITVYSVRSFCYNYRRTSTSFDFVETRRNSVPRLSHTENRNVNSLDVCCDCSFSTANISFDAVFSLSWSISASRTKCTATGFRLSVCIDFRYSPPKGPSVNWMANSDPQLEIHMRL